AVGDQAFQKKCIGRMGEIAAGGRTVLLVSHNLPMLTNLCSRAVWLNEGRVERSGPTGEIIGAYCRHGGTSTSATSSASLVEHPGRISGPSSLLRGVRLLNEHNEPISTVMLGGTLVVEVETTGLPQRTQTDVLIDICDE